MLEMEQLQTVKKFFRWYYFNNSEKIRAPESIESREFGYRDFNGNMIRHLSFKNEGEYRAFLVKNVPKSVYYSVAFYSDPTAPMESKGLIKADLAFDIDIKDVSEKIKGNSFWICKKCHSYGNLPAPKSCPNCGSEQIEEIEWVCDECLNEVKNAAIALFDILSEDFGLSKKEISVYFSGNNGYHFYVYNEEIRKMSQQERMEMVEYITMNGFNRSIFLKNVPENGSLINRKKVPIDPNVTVDIRRIFRAPDSLHDESGLAKKEIPSLESFDPFKEAVVLPEEPIEVSIHYMPVIKFKEQVFGPYKGERVKVPAYVAVYVVLKGLAEFTDNRSD
ncbi:MAG: DNA primase small subunit [Conexivisphaerales archaeon]|nr:DNA primase small subunit [Conexivisphaerales archaeon]